METELVRTNKPEGDDTGKLAKNACSMPIEKCLIENQSLDLPEPLTEDLNLFMSVMSADTWTNVLSESQRIHLMKFLPAFPEDDNSEKMETLGMLFNGSNFKYGNPLKQFHAKLKGGRFSPDIAKYIDLCRKAKHREYKNQQHIYYSDLLKEILINRQRILQAASMLPPDEPIIFEHFQMKNKSLQPKSLQNRVKRRCAHILMEINKECGIGDSSSSDDDDDGESAMIARSRRQLYKALRPSSPDDMDSNILGTFDTPPPPALTNGVTVTPPPKRPLSPVELTENDLTMMLKKYKRRRQKEPHHPELYIAGLSVDDIITRVQAVKKLSKVVQKKKVRDRPLKKITKVKVKPEKPVSQEDEEIDVSGTFDIVTADEPSVDMLPSMKTETETDDWAQTPVLPQMTTVEQSPLRAHYFALIRDIIYEDPEQRITTQKIEERVQEWQETEGSMDNSWFLDQPNWVEEVPSALKFLSGDVLGLSLENFVPFLDYKERAQHWKWIGMGRDSDAELEPLYNHWLQHKDELLLDSNTKACASPPPPRSRTDFTVRPTTDEEKMLFREQERERFSNPHKAFTYILHGYEAVVGPVKGVYHKDNAMNKAREHTILVNDRPAYVTILTLVRDAAARLPNGEGTRSDICELLKDSQFLAPGVPDSQINTVVSGALDRLHYEKDPCVKYDVNRKLWIYLHRNRTQQEFERIHLAQGAAVKAKKALQKPKPMKRSKEGITTQPVSVITAGVTMVTSSLSSQKLVTLSSVNTESSVAVSQTSAPMTKITFTPSSPQVTPQNNPRIIVSSPLGSPQPAPVSKLMTSSLRQVTPQQASHIPTQNVAVSMTSQAVGEKEISLVTESVAGSTPPTQTTAASTTISIQSPSTKLVTGQSVMVGQQIAGHRPVTLSLLQPQGTTKVDSGPLSQTGKPRTVLLQTQGVKGSKILTHQLLRTPITQGIQVSGSPARVITMTTTTSQLSGATSSQATMLPSSSATPQQTLTAALARAGVVPSGVTAALTKVGGATVTGTAKPVLTRLVSGQPQIVTLSSLWASPPTLQQKTAEQKQTVKLQAGSLQSISSSGALMTSASLVTTNSQCTVPGSTAQTTISTANKIQQVTVTRGGKPTTMVIGKQLGAGGRSLTSTTQTVAQIIQSGALVGKSAIIGGKPIIIGGKSASLGGKPIQLTSKPVQLGGKPMQLGGKPVQLGGKPVQLVGKGAQIGLIQSPGLVSAVNVVTQVSTLDTQAISMATQANTTVQTSASATKTAADGAASTVVTMVTKSGHGSPMVSQLLKSVQQHTHNKPTQFITLPQGSEGQVKISGQVQGQQVKLAGQQQVVTLSGSGHKIVTLAQGVGGLTQIQQISGSKTAVGGTTKSIMIPAGAILQDNHFMLQQANLSSTTKVLTPQLLSGGGGVSRPALITTGGIKGLQNIQLVKTVISQPGGKPGQTTILLAQPSSQTVTVASDSKVTQASGTKPKSAPVYARIITPPPGVRLAAVRPGQVLTGIQVAPVQGLNMVQAVSQASVANIQQAVGSVQPAVGGLQQAVSNIQQTAAAVQPAVGAVSQVVGAKDNNPAAPAATDQQDNTADNTTS